MVLGEPDSKTPGGIRTRAPHAGLYADNGGKPRSQGVLATAARDYGCGISTTRILPFVGARSGPCQHERPNDIGQGALCLTREMSAHRPFPMPFTALR